MKDPLLQWLLDLTIRNWFVNVHIRVSVFGCMIKFVRNTPKHSQDFKYKKVQYISFIHSPSVILLLPWLLGDHSNSSHYPVYNAITENTYFLNTDDYPLTNQTHLHSLQTALVKYSIRVITTDGMIHSVTIWLFYHHREECLLEGMVSKWTEIRKSFKLVIRLIKLTTWDTIWNGRMNLERRRLRERNVFIR